MRTILYVIFLIILVSCKPEDECDNINTKIEQWNQKMTLHPRAYNFLLDSIYRAYSKAEMIECEQSLGMAIEFKLWYFTRLCNANEAIDYVSQLDEKRFAYPNKKEMYLNLYRAMKAWSRFEDNYLEFLLKAENAAKEEYDQTRLYDALIDLYMCKSLHVEEDRINMELDSLYHLSGDEAYLHVISLIQNKGDLLVTCFGPIRTVFD